MVKKYAHKIEITQTDSQPGGRKILVADDKKDTCYIISFNLERAGFRVIQAFDGEETLKKAIEELPNLIILDIAMPKLDGYRVTKELRKNERTKKIPIIIITTKGRFHELFGSKPGTLISEFVEKPFSVTTLMEKVNAILPFKS